METVRSILWQHREGRIKPFRDDACVASWNGLWASAAARVAILLGDELDSSTLDFIKSRLVVEEAGETKLLHGYKANFDQTSDGFGGDYANVIEALLDSYGATWDSADLALARNLQATMDRLFFTGDGYVVSKEHSSGIERYDGSEPAITSTACRNLARLAAIFDDGKLRQQAVSCAKGCTDWLQNNPVAVPLQAVALEWVAAEPACVVVVGDDALATAVRRAVRDAPVEVLVRNAESVALLGERIADYTTPGAYVCLGMTCGLPAHDLAGVLDQLKAVAK